MTSISSTVHSSQSPNFQRAVISARIVMFSMGLAIIAATTRFAEIKAAIGADDQTFGTVISAAGLGGLISTSFSARLADWIGTKRVVEWAGLVTVLSSGASGFARSIPELALAAVFGGLGYSAMNIAINAQGVEIERGLGRSVMPTMHGIWSVGALTAALGGNIAAGAISVQLHMAINTGVALLFMLWASRGLLPRTVASSHDTADSSGSIPRGAWPAMIVLTLSFAMGMVGDSGAFDWSAIHLHEDLNVDIGPNSLGVTVFLISQIIIRMLGGRLADRFGLHVAVRVAAAVGSVGYGVALVVSQALAGESESSLPFYVMLVGIFALGIGTGLVPSAMLSAAGSLPGVSTARGIATVLLMLNVVMLGLKPLIALTAEGFGLTVALLVTAVGLSVLVWTGRILRAPMPAGNAK